MGLPETFVLFLQNIFFLKLDFEWISNVWEPETFVINFSSWRQTLLPVREKNTFQLFDHWIFSLNEDEDI